MNNTTENSAADHRAAPVTFRLPTLANDVGIKDAGRVRIGGLKLGFRGAIADAGKVKLGGLGPAFRRSLIAEAGRVRLGGLGPLFR